MTSRALVSAVMCIITSKWSELAEVLLGVVLSQPITTPLLLIDILLMYSYVVAHVQENLESIYEL